ncbi:glycoside hydrolase family 99-like domain-containing protein [Stappia sp.]|uniref:glycoside hydrolase family 99-like domain-containing protein n=1 Tax=Stappia sp. TaxID=1870903 RepID=UPI003A99105B
MHDTALDTGRLFFELYWRDTYKRILDVGSMNVNGTLRDVAPANCDYVGTDIAPGPAVDVITNTAEAGLPFADDSFDIVVSTSCFEHDQMFWQTFLELLRVVRPNGFVYINAPSNGPYHGYPYDNWRFYPDSGRALQAWAEKSGFKGYRMVESLTVLRKGDIWNDFALVFAGPQAVLPETLLQDRDTNIYNARNWKSDEIHVFADKTEDMRLIDRFASENDELRQELARKNEEAANGRQEIATLRGKLEQNPLIPVVHNLNQDLREMRARNETQAGQLASAEQALAVTAAEQRLTLAALEEARGESRNLSAKLAASNAQASSLTQENARLQTDNALLQNGNAALQAHIAELQARATSEEDTRKSLEVSLAGRTAELQQSDSALQQAKTELSGVLELAAAALPGALEPDTKPSPLSAVAALRDEIVSLCERVARLSEKEHQMEAQISNLQRSPMRSSIKRIGTLLHGNSEISEKIDFIRKSRAFEFKFYKQQNRIWGSRSSCIKHYMRAPDFRVLRPTPLFDGVYYTSTYQDVADSRVNPFYHYLRFGVSEGRNPNPLFSTSWYLERNPDVSKGAMNPLVHYLRHGAKEGRDPHPLFSTNWYLAQYPDVAKAGANPLAHFLLHGAQEGRNPNPYFDSMWYLERNPDVQDAGEIAVYHYLKAGHREGRDPSPRFSVNAYRQRHLDGNPDVDPLSHFLSSGRSGADLEIAPSAPRPTPQSASTVASQEGRSRTASHETGAIDLQQWRTPFAGNPGIPASDAEIGVFLHIYYPDLTGELLHAIEKIKRPYRLYISTDTDEKKVQIVQELEKHGLTSQAVVKIISNIGRDFGSLILGFTDEIRRHDICLRIHSKKSTHNSAEFGERWRRYLIDELLGTDVRAREIIGAFEADPDLGLVIPHHWPSIANWVTIGDNHAQLSALLQRVGLSIGPSDPIEFPSGAMFWFRSNALAPLLDLNLQEEDFRPAKGEDRDATIAHAIERGLVFFSCLAGYKWAKVPRLHSLEKLDLPTVMHLVGESGLFDTDFYFSKYPDVKAARANALKHYCEAGYREDRDPSALMDTKFYRRLADIRDRNINPIIHYLLEGQPAGLALKRPTVRPATVQVDDLYAAYKRLGSNPEYVGETKPLLRQSTVKPIAFYLPQFHPFAENDRFWGRGFTEWTNTSKAPQLFAGHYQPRLPGELGFYDTRLKEVLARQMELARQYGIHGFCLHHYFFDGKPIMRAPYNHILENPDLDLPFCLHWANEPWTATWDGLATRGGTLLPQTHSPKDDIAFFEDIAPAIRDPRYITVDGRPLLVIYRPRLFPDMAATIERWRECCHKLGLPDLYLTVMQTGFEGRVNPRKYGFDAAIEYPPHNFPLQEISEQIDLYDPFFTGRIHDYREAKAAALARKKEKYKLFRGIITDWDCTARRGNPDILINSTPEDYGDWMRQLCEQTALNLPESEQFIFINAWNEWAEGAYLEPDRKFGYAYLDANARAMNSYERPKERKTASSILVGAHLYYTDLLDEFAEQFANVPGKFSLHVTTCSDDTDGIASRLQERLGNRLLSVEVLRVENVGRDMGPFIMTMLPKAQNHDLCCWVHSKKSVYEPNYATWRGYLLDNLLGSPDQVKAVIEAFESDAKLGLVYPEAFPPIADRVEWGSNFPMTRKLLKQLKVTIKEEQVPEFPAGGMYWFRPRALAPLIDLKLDWKDFEQHSGGAVDPDTGAITDGTLTHALERMITYVARKAGFHEKEVLFKAWKRP